MTVYVEKDGPLTTIILSRPEVRNAVDRQTAKELADAFRSFENDKAAKVAVFCGDQGQFCAGADLKKIAEGIPNRVEPAGDGPMGPTRMRLSKPVIAAIEQVDLPFEQALANEFKHGLRSLKNEAGTGATRFAQGAGRHGRFEKPETGK